MNISSVSATDVQAQKQQKDVQAGNRQLGKDEFLQLLVAQMQNQNPLNPMSGSEFVSQLSQFTSVEQLMKLNAGIDALANSQTLMRKSISNTMAASLAGKEVRAVSNRVNLDPGEDCTIPFKLGSTSTLVEISVVDSAGNTVRTVKLENLAAGKHTWKWNGETENGGTAPEGIYEIQISAYNDDKKIGALTFQEGTAEKVRYTKDGVLLMVNGVGIPLSDVREIGV